MVIAVLGLVLFALGLLSRFFSLWLYRRLVATESRPITPSRLTDRPLFVASSDADNLRRIVIATYVALIVGMALLMIGVLFV
jgi:hypothetical protein